MKQLGVPLAQAKMCGQVICIAFLGIKLDSVAGMSRLPLDKVSAFTESLETCLAGQESYLAPVASGSGSAEFCTAYHPHGTALL